MGDRRRGFNLFKSSLPRYTNFKVQDRGGTCASPVAPVANLRDCPYCRMLERTTPITSASISSEWWKLECTHILGAESPTACVDASTRSLELKKFAAYNRFIAYPRRAEPKRFEDHCARPCRKKRSAQPRYYVEPQFDPTPLQSLLTRFAFPVLVYAGATQATIMGAFESKA